MHHDRIIRGSTCLVAAQAAHSKGFVSLVNDFFSDGVGRMGFPLMTFAAKAETDIFLGDVQDIVRPMRIMAAGAISGFYRLA